MKFKKGDYVKRFLYKNNEWEECIFKVVEIIEITDGTELGYYCKDIYDGTYHNFWKNDSYHKLRKATKNEAIVYEI